MTRAPGSPTLAGIDACYYTFDPHLVRVHRITPYLAQRFRFLGVYRETNVTGVFAQIYGAYEPTPQTRYVFSRYPVSPPLAGPQGILP